MSALTILTRRVSHLFRDVSYRSLAGRSTMTKQLKNDQICSVSSVRLISESGKDCGVMTGQEAYHQAQEAGKDIIQVGRETVSEDKSKTRAPMIVRMIDLVTHEQERRRKEYELRKARKGNKMIERKEAMLKQIRLSPAIDTNDRLIKMRKVKEFLRMGHRVKVYMQFRRGQGRLHENAKLALISAAEELEDLGKIQGVPQDGEIADLFKKKKEDEDDDQPQQKTKPQLHFFVQPLPRKVREQLKEGEEQIT